MQNSISFKKINSNSEIPNWITRSEIVNYFHETMKPYEDTTADIERAIDFAFSDDRGGFLMLCQYEDKWAGQLLMLKTGMGGYIPENILLFVTVSPEIRGKGIGKKLIEHSVAQCDGDVKLHVEYDNPAKRLYERIGFTTKYAEMRFEK